MNMKSTAWGLALSLAVLPWAQTAENPAEIVSGNEANGKTIDLRVGQTVDVRLAGNPTTGYSWDVKALPPDTGSVQVQGPDYKPDAVAPGIVGSGGVFSTRIRGVRPGEQTLEWHYRRPWEKDVPPAEVVRIKIRVIQAPAEPPAPADKKSGPTNAK